MARNQLREFFREKKLRSRPTGSNGRKKLDAWIKAVSNLYDAIENDYLKPAQSEIEITRQDAVVRENDVGEYHIPELVLRVGDEQVVFSPKGINVFGAKGRIDVHGDCGETSLLWQPDGRWSVVATRAPTLRLVPLDADSLADLLKGIMRP